MSWFSKKVPPPPVDDIEAGLACDVCEQPKEDTELTVTEDGIHVVCDECKDSPEAE